MKSSGVGLAITCSAGNSQWNAMVQPPCICDSGWLHKQAGLNPWPFVCQAHVLQLHERRNLIGKASTQIACSTSLCYIVRAKSAFTLEHWPQSTLSGFWPPSSCWTLRVHPVRTLRFFFFLSSLWQSAVHSHTMTTFSYTCMDSYCPLVTTFPTQLQLLPLVTTFPIPVQIVLPPGEYIFHICTDTTALCFHVYSCGAVMLHSVNCCMHTQTHTHTHTYIHSYVISNGWRLNETSLHITYPLMLLVPGKWAARLPVLCFRLL